MSTSISVLSPRLLDLVDEDAALERLGAGFVFTEGPIWNRDGGYLLFSDIPADVMRRWDPDQGVTEARKPNNQGNGMTYDAAGRLVICEHATRRVARLEADGTSTVLASHFGSTRLNSPNDVVIGSDGTVYFTDPTYGVDGEGDLGFRGLYRINPADGAVELVDPDFDQPNGLCVSPDGSLLYVNDTERALIRVFPVNPDGSLAAARPFFSGITSGIRSDGVPDGMKCDRLGNVYVTGPHGIWIIDPDGAHLGVIEVPEVAANLNWGGADWQSLFITASTSLYRITLKVAGRVEPYMKVGRP
ncbi:MAG: SMP-30/gluconolactonase/LRE family protein [Acidimicrobiia bacterium]|nr:SMP-30/gluconolactonase/LRE family protein [Acidimicrobiia bacterium]